MANPAQPEVRPAIQHEAVDIRPILGFVVLSLMGMGLLVWLATFWFQAEADKARQRVAMDARYPDLERVEVAGRSLLNRYALQPDSSYMIPVEQAIELLAAEVRADTAFTSELP